MKYSVIKLKSIFVFSCLLIMITSCVKERTGFTDLTNVSDMVVLKTAGLGNFKAANIFVNPTSADTLHLDVTVDLASVEALNSALPVTIGVDDAKRIAYNTANGTNYQALPSNLYKLNTTNLTIPAGQHYAIAKLDIYQDKFDPTISFMLPISIMDASGKGLSSNQNTVYYNVIGNPIAGLYHWDFTRWGNPNQTGSPDISFVGDENFFVADNPTQVEVSSGYYIGPRYVINFTNTNGVLSNFKVSMNADDVATMEAAGIIITNGPNITKADPVTGEYEFWYTTLTRYVIDRYYK